ncbi:hypothetical protein niasHT_021286 [Heterodera trifolii]|uniref:CCHC-type domain-containing protein n=1 Tax=Heterodera trifolii TaxID=157864 RepID=A0ABD2JJK3_9BILA
MFCRLCKVHGHMVTECAPYRFGGIDGATRVACVACHGIGHRPDACMVLGAWLHWAVAYLGKRPVFPEQFVGRLHKCFVCGEDGHLWRYCRFGQLRGQDMNKSVQRHQTGAWVDMAVSEGAVALPVGTTVPLVIRPRNEIRFTNFMLANGAGEDAKYERQRAVARKTAQKEDTPWKWKGAMKPYDVITEAELKVWHKRYGSQRVILMQ